MTQSIQIRRPGEPASQLASLDTSHSRRGARAMRWLVWALVCSGLLTCRSRPQPEASRESPDSVPFSLALCSPGQVRCEGPAVQVCANDASGYVTLEICNSAALCQTDPARCAEATCVPDEMVCDGPELMLCNSNRSGFSPFDTCESAAHCSATDRRCLAEPCEQGQLRCNRGQDGVASLERCDEEQATWLGIDQCETRQLCDQTLATAASSVLAINSDGVLAQSQPLTEVTNCFAATCQPGEVQCDGAALTTCNEGRTGFSVVEQCGSAPLCELSVIEALNSRTLACVAGACEPGSFRCSVTGGLEVCDEDRTGFRVAQQCIGAAFCDAANGRCNDAPCESGAETCNDSQPQRCREDRSGFDALGAACASAALCLTEGGSAFCSEPACARGELSSNEYRCDGAALSRCREDRTGYEPVSECATAALCNPAAGLCTDPACAPGEHACDSGVLARCNTDRTDFESVENCGDASQCDATLGACTDPCEPGAARCTPQGEIEQCRDRLTGWRVTADCLTPELCNASTRSCATPACDAGATRCRPTAQATALERCAAGRHAFDPLQSCGPEEICDAASSQCDVCEAGETRCEGDTLVSCSADGQRESRQTCSPGLCSAEARRCLQCSPIGSARCSGLQLLVCLQGGEAEFEQSQDCESPALCQDTLQSGSQQCRDGVCAPGQVQCNGNRLEQCNAGLNGFDVVETCEPGLCNAQARRCDQCSGNGAFCINGSQRQFCQNGLFQTQTCGGGQICNEGQCIEPACNVGQFNCFGNALQLCNNSRTAFDFTQNCQNGLCNAAAGRCDACRNGQFNCFGNALQQCSADRSSFQFRQNCDNGLCNAGAGRCDACSTPGAFNCFGNALQQCSADRSTLNFVQNCDNGLCNAGAGRCDQCSGNAAQCVNNTQRQVCVGGLFQTQTCNNGQICQGGQCVQPQCDVGERRCFNGNAQVCNQTRTGFNNAQLCGANGCNGQTTQCNECNTATFQATCNASGTSRNFCNNGSIQTQACPNDEVCQSGACVPRPVCQVGETRCLNNLAQVCNATQTGFATSDVCLPSQDCNPTTGSCDDARICDAGSRSCNADGNFEVCSANGRTSTIDVCGSFGCSEFNAGGCRICDPSGPAACAPSGDLINCANDGQLRVTIPCGEFGCFGSECRICAPNRPVCGGTGPNSFLFECDATGTNRTAIAQCALGCREAAAGGECILPVIQ